MAIKAFSIHGFRIEYVKMPGMNMKLKFTLPIALALCSMLTGCFTENYENSHGGIVNLRSHKPPEIIQMDANGEGHLKNGSAYRLYSFCFCDDFNPKNPATNLWQWEDAYLLAIFYPTNVPNHALHTETNWIYARLVPNDLPEPTLEKHFKYLDLPNDAILTPGANNEFLKFFNMPYRAANMSSVEDNGPRYRQTFVNIDLTNEISAAESPTNLSIPGSIPLHGSVSIKPKSWFHRGFFHTDFDLTGDNGLKLEAKYTTYDYRRFEPGTFLLCLFWNGT
jgi:hypothetical protein